MVLGARVRYLQISIKIYHKQVKLFIFNRCVHVFHYLMRKTLSPSLSDCICFCICIVFVLSDEREFSINFFQIETLFQMSLFN